MRIVGIDQSKRSTALVSLDLSGKMQDFTLITPAKDIDKEYLIKYQWDAIHLFLCQQSQIEAIALEGAAFNAAGASNDLLWGIQWYIRTQLLTEYSHIPRGIIPVSVWRAPLLNVKEQRAFKLQYGGKIGLKHGVISKLPDSVRTAFEEYVEEKRPEIQISKGNKPESKNKVYKDAMFDLSDAWGVANFRLSLIEKAAKPTLKRRKLFIC